MQNFFETIKQLKPKKSVITVHGFKGKTEAIEAIKKSQTLYNDKFSKYISCYNYNLVSIITFLTFSH